VKISFRDGCKIITANMEMLFLLLLLLGLRLDFGVHPAKVLQSVQGFNYSVFNLLLLCFFGNFEIYISAIELFKLLGNEKVGRDEPFLACFQVRGEKR
jgi:hypothetical protein